MKRILQVTPGSISTPKEHFSHPINKFNQGKIDLTVLYVRGEVTSPMAITFKSAIYIMLYFTVVLVLTSSHTLEEVLVNR